MPPNLNIVPLEHIDGLIYVVRGQKVMLDRDLAALYGVETRVLNQAMRRNRNRFPDDFVLGLRAEETDRMMSQIVISSTGGITRHSIELKRNRRLPVMAFTEQGVAMLSSVLHSPRAIRVNIEIMRAFVRLRQMLASNTALARRLKELEKKYDAQFKVVFEAIRQLMAGPPAAPEEPQREIGFHTLRESDQAASPPRTGRRPRRIRY